MKPSDLTLTRWDIKRSGLERAHLTGDRNWCLRTAWSSMSRLQGKGTASSLPSQGAVITTRPWRMISLAMSGYLLW